MNELTHFELGWLVGILEGEGHFGLYTSQVIEVNMTDEDTVYKVASLFEKIVGSSINVMVIYKPSGRDVFCARIYGERARKVMKLVVPYMSHRRRQAIWRGLNGFKGPKVDLAKILDLKNMKETI